jgi:hypothetical protein
MQRLSAFLSFVWVLAMAGGFVAAVLVHFAPGVITGSAGAVHRAAFTTRQYLESNLPSD